MRLWPLLPLLPACAESTLRAGPFEVRVDRSTGRFDVSHEVLGDVATDLRFDVGTGDAEITSRFGAFLFEDVESSRVPAAAAKTRRSRVGFQLVTLEDAGGDAIADVVVEAFDEAGAADVLVFDVAAADLDRDRMGLSVACQPDEPVLGLGSHAMDVDHGGEAFGLWTSEPGIGKVDSEEPPEDWYVTGTRHASSYPVPFVLRPDARSGLLVDTTARVDVDLCASDERIDALAWSDARLRVVLFAGPTPLDVVSTLSAWSGRPPLPPPWVFAPWNDAIRGSDRVREVAATLREAGAPSSVIWTEDWKGGQDTANGYRLSGEWRLDRSLYPDAEDLAGELHDDGFRWYAYFAPFLREGTATWDEALAAGAMVLDDEGEPYTFTGASLDEDALVDLSGPRGRAFTAERLEAALDLGFDGWMADYGEWLPHDAALASGEDPMLAHNRYPADWQAASVVALDGRDASFFARSGWQGAQGLAPVQWVGDQRTSFDADDGLPSVIPLVLGLSASGQLIATHDVGGYQSVGNPPSDQELWFRWASLGAFSPVLRTHHGAFEADNHQFDTNAETLEHWVRLAREHTRMFPYRYGLAARAVSDGVPMVLPVGFRYDADLARTDAWLLGDALLVAPVTTRGATGRDVDLPSDVTWFDWWTGDVAESGYFEAAVDEIPVFAASGTTVPLFVDVPDTLADGGVGVTGLADVDVAREVLLFGRGGPFVEADGTTYTPSGAPTGDGTETATLVSGTVEVAGVTLRVDGTVERTYTVRVFAP
jgi:alpha-glucosidase